MEKLLVFGGTFNPIHNGHIALYRHFADALHVNRVLLIPSRFPPHKQPTQLASGEARMEMCRLATRDDARVQVSDIELRRAGASYTVDTLRTLAAQYPGAQLYLIIGSDMLFSLNTWREAAEVMRLAAICALPRHEGELAAMRERACEWERRYGGRFLVDETRVIDISSTELRQMVARGEDISAYVPREVEAYLKRNGMYHADE